MKHNWERDENGNINEWAWEAGFHNGVFCVDCGKSVCVHCNPDYMEFDDCTGPQKPKVITNADRIRSMSDEELAEFLSDFKDCAKDCLVGKGVKDCSEICATSEALRMWLQQPTEEET